MTSTNGVREEDSAFEVRFPVKAYLIETVQLLAERKCRG